VRKSNEKFQSVHVIKALSNHHLIRAYSVISLVIEVLYSVSDKPNNIKIGLLL